MKTPQLQVNLTESPTLGDTFTINDITLTYNEKGIIISAQEKITGTETFKNAKNNIEVIC